MLKRLTELLPKPLKALAIRFDRSPIDSVERLADFAQTRSAYVTQTALFGYLKARMGTRYTVYFEDPEFSASIRTAAARLFASGLSDLTVFCVATVASGRGLDAIQAADLARQCYGVGLRRALADLDPDQVPDDAMDLFDKRVATIDWGNATQGASAFSGSEADLVRYAPVIDEFKQLDREIVSNSIRFRWRDVREQFLKRVEPAAVCREWLERDHF